MQKSVLNVILIVVTLALVAYAVYLLIKGDQPNAVLFMVCALVVWVIVRSMIL